MPNPEIDQLLNSVAEQQVLQFSYDKDGNHFLLGGQPIPLNCGWEDAAYAQLLGAKYLEPEDLLEFPVVFGGLADTFGLPKLRDFLAGLGDERLLRIFKDTRAVMSAVHCQVSEEQYGNQEYSANPDSFKVGRIMGSGMPDFIYAIHTSLSPIASGSIGQSGWQSGIAEYGTNNEEMAEDRAALFAGLGHIAHLAQK